MLAKPKHTIEGVLFDWDGTLVNSYLADTSAYLAMFKEMGIGGSRNLKKTIPQTGTRFIALRGCLASAGMTRTAPGAATMQSIGRSWSPVRARSSQKWETLII